jgi:acyl-CoA reductase-like NAD-dependent aldehyde dehydrogenase
LTTTYNIENPFDSSYLGSFSFSTSQEVEETLSTLKQGRETMSQIASYKRAEILEKLSELVASNMQEIARLVSLEVGKPITESLGEIKRSVSVALCASHEARRIEGEILDCDAYSDMQGKKCHVMWKPLGTILAITPFNFPFNLAMHKIAPAFAAGNTIFFKPGPQNYLSAKLLVDLCYEAGIPKNCLILSMPQIMDMKSIIEDPRVSCINFTGGLVAAKAIASQAGFKKLLFELGGNDPLILMPDGNLEAAVSTTIAQRFGTAGQRCNACKRLYIHEDRYEEFKQLLIKETLKIKIGNPIESDTDLGPLINSVAADLVKSRIDDAISGGATLLAGNIRDGNIIYPTILENVSEEMEVVREETFGPVVPLFKFSNIDDVIKKINDSPYALQSGIFTNDLSVIKKLHDKLEVGSVNVNAGPGFRADHMPFGGVKDSGIGREGLRYAIREMSYQKNLIL